MNKQFPKSNADLGVKSSASTAVLRHAFTLVELLIAMTVTLLLMAALAKIFGSLGRSIQDGRAQVNLSSKMRNISFRMRTDMRYRTAKMTPPLSPTSGQGYFMYHEGPLTESTYANYGAEPIRKLSDGTEVGAGTAGDIDTDSVTDFFDPDLDLSTTYRRLSRYGDFDDYIAFTAEARGDDWFTGKVPRYLVDDTVYIDTNGNGIFDPGTDTVDQVAAMEPTLIRSKYAEIIIWASPEWDIDDTTAAVRLADHPSGMPVYQDDNNDLVPDRIVLHQRVLLIRPDLNSRLVIPNATNALEFETEVIRPLGNSPSVDAVPDSLARCYPIGVRNSVAPANTGFVTYDPIYPNYVDPGTVGAAADHRLFNQSNWLVGMAPMHHFFDLSLRRVTHPQTGEPTPFVACNSLVDLVQPHNRFGHVRYPGRYMGRTYASTGTDAGFTLTDSATSMPLLATGWNNTLLNWQGTGDPRWEGRFTISETPSAAVPAWFPTGHFDTRTRNLSETGTDQLTGLFRGWLLPHFELGNANPIPNTTGGAIPEPDNEGWFRRYLPTYDARWDRSGEDVLMGNVLAFDVKAFDRTAPVFATAGLDGAPGRVGVDDDGLAPADVLADPGTGDLFSELGTAGSDDEIVRVGDLGIYPLMASQVFSPDTTSTDGGTVTYGAGDTLTQGVIARGDYVDLSYPYLAGSPLGNHTTSPGVGVVGRYNSLLASEFSQHSIRGSGVNGVQILYGDSMKHSGKMLHAAGFGIVYFQPTLDSWTDAYETDGFDQTSTLLGNAANPPTVADLGTVWVLKSVQTNSVAVPNRINNADTVTAASQIDNGGNPNAAPEVPPPYPVDVPSLSITMRVEDPATGELTEYTVIEELD